MKGAAVFRFISFLILAAGWGIALFLWFERVSPRPIHFTHPAAPRVEIEPPAMAELSGLAAAFAREKQALPAAALAFVVLDENGDTLFASPLANTAMCPASALKTLTSAAALEILGPDFRFETRLAGTTRISADGHLDGDLVIIGGGDPTLSPADLKKMADALVAAGLKKISGQIRADASIFPHDPANEHWNWGDIGNAYGAGAFGLNVNHNRMLIRFDPAAEEGNPAKILGMEPSLSGIRWDNLVRTGAARSGDRVMVFSSPYATMISTRGTVPLGEPGFAVRAAIPDPISLAVEILSEHLQSAGVEILGQKSSTTSTPPAVLHTHHSEPLPEIIDHLHRVSDNLESQCLFLMLGHREKVDPASVVRGHFEKSGVVFEGLRMLDGSGLARANMIRPMDLACANLAARKGPNGERFLQSLYRHPAGFRSKNGAMSGVRTEVGFIRRADDSEAVFAIMANGLTGAVDFHGIRERLLTAAARN